MGWNSDREASRREAFLQMNRVVDQLIKDLRNWHIFPVGCCDT